MPQTSPALNESLLVGGKLVSITTLLISSAGFRTEITVPPGCSRELRATLAVRARDWCKFQNVEHEEATIQQRWDDGQRLILEGTGWQPEARDMLHLSLFLQGKTDQVRPTIVTEDLETNVAPLRLHDLPASVQASAFPDPLLAQTG